jgi:hypothetical protein
MHAIYKNNEMKYNIFICPKKIPFEFHIHVFSYNAYMTIVP